MASVNKRTTAKGTVFYRAIWTEAGRGGKKRQRSKNFPTAREAKTHAAKMEQEVENRGVGDPDKHTLESYLKRWISTLEYRGEHSPTTIAGYRRHIGLVSRHIGHIPLERVSPADLDQLYATLLREGGTARKPNKDGSKGTRPLTARTVLHVHRCLNVALDRARKWKLISENPVKDAEAPSPLKSRVKAFGKEQVEALLAAAERDPETYLLTALFLACGLRRSEVLGLAWDAVDLDRGTLEIRRVVVAVDHKPIMRERAKTECSYRTVAMPAALVDLLREQKVRVHKLALKWGKGYCREPMLVFPGLAGEPGKPMSLTLRMRQVMRRAKVVGLSPCHAWRHTSATSLLHAGENVKTVQARLGHSTPAITLALYMHADDEHDRAAADHFQGVLKR